ncbi:MAG TPA: phosphate ABC transporter permease subunit PstC [Phycisphaerales bacterium]|nr:phosphate ABC transporter permease subunit PstC [Phycisphaerales bacterium]
MTGRDAFLGQPPQAILADPRRLRSHRRQRVVDRTVVGALGAAATLSVLVTAAILFVLGTETVRFFRQDEVSLGEFFGSARWSPLLGSEKHFGIWPLVCGTALVAGIALLVAVPLGLVTAIFLSEYAPPRVRATLKPALEVLAGIPTVVYGFLALVLVTPGLRLVFDGLGSYNAISAGIAVGVLIVPIISSVSEDAMRAVPQALRDGVYGVGGTRFDAAVKVVFPAALSGIVSAVLLAAARAIGETMIVALAAGSTPKVTLDPTEEVQTMTGFMVQMALGDVSNFGVEYFSMYAVAAMLFALTMGFTLLGAHVRRRFREAYE